METFWLELFIFVYIITLLIINLITNDARNVIYILISTFIGLILLLKSVNIFNSEAGTSSFLMIFCLSLLLTICIYHAIIDSSKYKAMKKYEDGVNDTVYYKWKMISDIFTITMLIMATFYHFYFKLTDKNGDIGWLMWLSVAVYCVLFGVGMHAITQKEKRIGNRTDDTSGGSNNTTTTVNAHTHDTDTGQVL